MDWRRTLFGVCVITLTAWITMTVVGTLAGSIAGGIA
jgi:hypothetical protein